MQSTHRALEAHPLALLVPDMAAEDLAALRASIEAQGLLDAITLYEGKILDGRHRVRLCEELAIAPRFEDYRGTDPLGFVLAKNLARRHLTASQKAMIAARVANLKRGGDRRSSNFKGENSPLKVTVADAARMVGVDEKTVDRARAVLASGNAALIAQVERGVLPVHEAARRAREPGEAEGPPDDWLSMILPLSLLDTRTGKWQTPKKDWLALGIQSELGRDANLLGMSETVLLPDPQKRQAIQTLLGPDGGGVLDLQRLISGGPHSRDLGEHLGATNIEAVIPDYYRMRDAGMSDEEILRDALLSGANLTAGTSVFNPVLCACMYKWFCPPGGRVLDPFAGGSVRGIVVSCLGLHYVGIDLSAAQVEANRKQVDPILEKAKTRFALVKPRPQWIVGDSRRLDSLLPSTYDADFVFTCPPYYKLQRYSDDPADLSNAHSYGAFCEALEQVMSLALARLKLHRFACVVISNIRDRQGFYLNLVGDAVRICERSGARFYNDAVLVTPTGSLAIRYGPAWNSSRKLGRVHQNVLVFCKGDPKKATRAQQLIDASNPFASKRAGSRTPARKAPRTPE